MKFSCEKAVLMAAVSAASRTVTTRTSIPALEGLLVEASNTTVTLTGYNLATGIRAIINTNTEEQGRVVINARLLSDIVRRSPDDYLTISSDDKLTVTISSGMSQFTLIGLSPSDFPALPEMENDITLSIPQNTLKSMISMTSFAISDNENKPVHTGSLFDISGGRLNLVSVDGYRLAIRREEVLASKDNFSFVVPGAALREVERLCSEDDEKMSITLGQRHITFDMGDVILISRLLEGEFLKYDTAIPQNCQFRVTADTKELQQAVERVSLIISERLKNPVRCLFEDGRLKLGCNTSIGRANDEIAISGNGGDIEIGFNNRYLQDAIRAVPDEKVIIELVNGLSPCIFRPVEGDKYLFMVLPVRLRA